jgi:hypothetical protein
MPVRPYVFHPRIPVPLLGPACPMRSLREPAFAQYVDPWIRWRRYQTLPEGGGTNDQDNQTMQALDAMESGAAHEDPAVTARRRAQRAELRRRGWRGAFDPEDRADG